MSSEIFSTSTPTPARLLARRLPVRLLGQELGPDVYLRNGFRLLGASAGSDEDELERVSQKARNLLRLSPDEVPACAFALDYEEHARLRPADTEIGMAHLRSPRSALIDRLFWPHVAAETFRNGDGRLHLASPGVASALKELRASGGGRGALLARHAEAIILHNRALDGEISFVAERSAGRGEEWDGTLWRAALEAWGEVLRAEPFWGYVGEILEELDEPTLGGDEVVSLRATLPAAILSFHALFASVHGLAGWEEACLGHLELLRRAPFPADLRHQALGRAGREVVGALLTPLLHRLEEEVLRGTEPIPRETFAPGLDRILGEIEALHRRLRDGLGLPDEILAGGAFDDLASRVIEGVDKRLDYRDEERERSLLYGFLALRRLGELPLSPLLARKAQEVARDHAGHLYGTNDDGSPVWEPAECWFLPGEVPDAEAAIAERFYRIDSRQVEVDPLRQTAGVRVSWQKRRLLVPRSRVAADRHAQAAGDVLPTLAGISVVVLAVLTSLAGVLPLGFLGALFWGAILGWVVAKALRALRQRSSEGPQVRPLSDSDRFPPRSKLVHEGFKQGQEPTQLEMQMTAAERNEAISRLRPWRF